MSKPWLSLVVGNSRLHWAVILDGEFISTWDTPHLSSLTDGIQLLASHIDIADPELWIASVVPSQSALWQEYAPAYFIALAQVPLGNTYPTLGIDRALAVWGAIQTVGSPVLVIDAGTALTFTAADADHQLIGGAILPGLQLQFQSLGQATASLPTLFAVHTPPAPPPLWATSTEDAIASGIIHTLTAGILSFIEDWWHQFPQSAVVLTGGDGELLHQWLKARSPQSAAAVMLQPHIVFKGVQAIRQQTLKSHPLSAPIERCEGE